jgi:FlaA1/EpsC-like NDP-sugar epimerase
MQQAVEAILSAGRSRQSGKLLLPAVGEPILIGELAASLISEAGRGAGIRYIGLRPGEKLTEELRGAHEREVGNEENLTVIEGNRLKAADIAALSRDLSGRVRDRDLSGLLAVIRRAVPEYEPSEHLLRQAAVAAGASA